MLFMQCHSKIAIELNDTIMNIAIRDQRRYNKANGAKAYRSHRNDNNIHIHTLDN